MFFVLLVKFCRVYHWEDKPEPSVLFYLQRQIPGEGLERCTDFVAVRALSICLPQHGD